MAVKNGTECQTIPPATMKVFHLYILIAGRREGKKRMESERGKRGVRWREERREGRKEKEREGSREGKERRREGGSEEEEEGRAGR